MSDLEPLLASGEARPAPPWRRGLDAVAVLLVAAAAAQVLSAVVTVVQGFPDPPGLAAGVPEDTFGDLVRIATQGLQPLLLVIAALVAAPPPYPGADHAPRPRSPVARGVLAVAAVLSAGVVAAQALAAATQLASEASTFFLANDASYVAEAAGNAAVAAAAAVWSLVALHRPTDPVPAAEPAEQGSTSTAGHSPPPLGPLDDDEWAPFRP